MRSQFATHSVQLTDFNGATLSALQLAQPEEIWFAGANGDQVHAFFFKPSTFQHDDNKEQKQTQKSNKKYPLALVIHGGPAGAINSNWHYRWNPQVLAARGMAVLCPNFHGSTGYGQAFVDSMRADWGGKAMDDVQIAVDVALKQNSWLDKTRVAALGASYGGYAINWLNGHTNRFKCFVNHDGVYSLPNMALQTDELFFCDYEFKGQPWNSKVYTTHSPHTYVANWRTPTLVITGSMDFRVPETESLATFTALQRLKVPSQLLVFPDENHWTLRRENSLVWHDTVLRWLQRFIGTQV
jgi:dipeptidyl aminopeptidase/acylaminoacyl peptidase